MFVVPISVLGHFQSSEVTENEVIFSLRVGRFLSNCSNAHQINRNIRLYFIE